MDPAIISIISTVILAIIGFFLIRYFRSVDGKLEHLTNEMNKANINFAEIKVGQKSYSEFITETKTKLEDFINEIRDSLREIKKYIDKKIDGLDLIVQKNNDNIIRLEEREKELIKKVERLTNIQDNCKSRKQ